MSVVATWCPVGRLVGWLVAGQVVCRTRTWGRRVGRARTGARLPRSEAGRETARIFRFLDQPRSLATIAGAGHLAPLETPEAFRELLLAFLSEAAVAA